MDIKIQEQIRQVCEYILANSSQVESPKVLASARGLLKLVLDVKGEKEDPAKEDK